MPQRAKVSISIVSHGQAALIENLLHDLRAHCTTPLEVILTLNIPEPVSFDVTQFGFSVEVIKNEHAKGFAANHNAAFSAARSDLFCVLNPDVRFTQDPFPRLLEQIADPKIGVAAPLILNPSDGVEDSARRFPTPLGILRKVLIKNTTLDYPIGDVAVFPDWVAGMFMVFRSELFRAMGGFDTAYFLYYEDVDLCWRLRRSGYEVVLTPAARVVHAAQRASHRNFQHLRWHVASMLRFFVKRRLGQRHA
jgi:N-acetylglucosaminyl-diphospho-decaprenol L-rhamnosyltransferase